MSDDRDIGNALIFLGVGVYLFFWGFKRLRRKRKIENIPTSTVRGLAMGLVELVGKAKKEMILKGPLSGEDCVFYRYTVERYQSSGKSGRWVIIAKGDSTACPFWLEDGTGKVLVLTQTAEWIMPVDYSFETGLGKSLAPNLIEFLEKNNIKYHSFLGNYPLRFKEWHVSEDDSLYVLGTASSISGNIISDHKQELIQRLEALKVSPQQMVKFDTNKDGQISNEEWDLAVKAVEQELIEQELKSAPSIEPISAIISKANNKDVFIISDYSQKDLLQKLTWQAFGGIFGGAALALAMLWWLLFRIGH
jgi:hypothetical protein